MGKLMDFGAVTGTIDRRYKSMPVSSAWKDCEKCGKSTLGENGKALCWRCRPSEEVNTNG